jgi:hypothetical protein
MEVLPYPSLFWIERETPNQKEDFYNCTTRPKYNTPAPGYCMVNRTCPVSRTEVASALDIQTWDSHMNAICLLADEISKVKQNSGKYGSNHSINLIVIGGSMTQGAGTESECVCIHSEDSRCPLEDRSKVSFTFCSWSKQFTNWIVSEFPMIQFNVSILVMSGLTSAIVPDFIDSHFRQLSFSDNDIILIDESVDDAAMHFNDLKQDVESMIRRIYGATRGAFPTVIMIEQYPHRSYSDGEHHRSSYENRVLPGDYATIYRNLSEHYGLVYYSMREVYWTNLNENILKSNRYPFSPFYDWHVHAHPPWYFHHFMADVMANCFLSTLSRCRHRQQASLPRYNLPPPYYNKLSTGDYCDMTQPYLLDAHPTNHFHPDNLKDFEEGEGAQKSGWREYADYHNVSGWIINSYSDPLQRRLSFPILRSQTHSFESLLVVVQYLKSYVGMGAAEVIVCGVSARFFFDGLYVDHRTNRVSIPTMVAFQVNDKQRTACLAISLENRTVDIVYRPHMATDPDGVRQHKKMKILSVKVCNIFSH